MSISFKQALLCDDIRIENTGKFILIGIYASDITVGVLPSTFVGSLALLTQTDFEGEFELQFRAFLNGSRLFEGAGKVTVQSPSSGLLPIKPLMLELGEEGVLRFEVRQAPRGEWQEVCALPVKVDPTLIPSN